MGSRVTVAVRRVGAACSGDKNTSRVRLIGYSYLVLGTRSAAKFEQRGKRGEGRSRKTFGRHLNTNAREGAKRTKSDKNELRLATKHLLHGFQVPEVRLCARKTFPTRRAVQLIKGDGEKCERIEGGSQRVD